MALVCRNPSNIRGAPEWAVTLMPHYRPVTLLRNALPLMGAFAMAPTFLIVSIGVRVLVRPLSAKWAAAVDNLLYSGYLSYVVLLYEGASGAEVVFHGPDDVRDTPDDEMVVFISNHQCTMDWVVANMVACRQSMGAIGRTHYIMKSAVRFLPWYGLYLYMRGCGLVHRNWQKDEAGLARTVQWYATVGARPWIVLFPEGTRYNPKDTRKLSQSQEFAVGKGLPVLHNVLAPRVRGFRALCSEVRRTGAKAAVYHVTVAYGASAAAEGRSAQGQVVRPAAPSMLNFLGGSCGRLDLRFARIPIESVPLDSEENTQKWLSDLFAAKDEWLAQVFAGTHSCTPEGGGSANQPAAATDANTGSMRVPCDGRSDACPPLPFWSLAARATVTACVCLSPWAMLPAGTALKAAAGSAAASVLVSYFVI